MNSIKRYFQAFGVAMLFAFLFLNEVKAQNIIPDGAMTVSMYIGASYRQGTDGSILGGCDGGFGNNCEFRWTWWGADNADLDGQGWRGGTTIGTNTTNTGWINQQQVLLFTHTYGTAGNTPQDVPQFVQLRVEGWEDDCYDCAGGFICFGNCGTNYSSFVYDGNCPNCGCDCNGEDQHCLQTMATAIPFRQVPPCAALGYNGPAWVGDFFTTGCGSGNNGGHVLVRYTPPIPVSATASPSNLCAPGIVTLTATGVGFGGTYHWYNSAGNFLGSGSPITVNVTGNETFRVHGVNNNCESLSWREVSVTVGVPLVATVNTTSPSCPGATDGIITVSASGNGPFQYSSNNGSTWQGSNVFNNVPAGIYQILVQDQFGCIGAYSGNPVVITNPSGVSISSVTKTDADCNGAATGSITITTTTGTNILYSINGGLTFQASNTFSNLAAGSYNISIVYGNNCSATYANNPVMITEPQPINYSTVNTTNISCNGGNDGTIVIIASGGTGSFSYSIDNGTTWQTSNSFSGLTAGSYGVRVRDANNCVAVFSGNPVVLTEPTPLTLSLTGSDPSCSGVFNGSISISGGGGTPPYSYSINGGAPQIGSSFVNLSAGTYVITLIDNKACQLNDTIVLTNQYAVTVTVQSTIPVSCFGGNNGSVTVSPSGGISPYQYSIDNINFQSTPTFSGLSAGNYTIVTIDASGCTVYTPVNIGQPTQVSVSVDSIVNVSCFGNTTGGIFISASGGTPPYTYSWSNNSNNQNLTNVPSGTYIVTVTDANGCQGTASGSLVQAPQLFLSVASQTNVSCFGGSNGSIDITVNGGTPPYSFLWSSGQTSEDVFGLPAGTYGVTVTDANNCTISLSTTLTEPSALTATTSGTNVTCFGQASGSISVSASGGTAPYSYLWSNFANTATVNNVTAGSYSVVVTDANGCTVSATRTVTQPAELIVSLQSTNPDCFGATNGSVTATVSGGTGSYTYQWNVPGNTATISNLQTGTYSVTVTDAANCSQTASITLTQPTAISVVASSSDATCFGQANGTAALTVSGGSGPYSYNWSNGQTTPAISGLVAGLVSYTVTDALNCSQNGSITISEPTALTGTISTTDVTCFGGTDGTASITASGGTPPYSYLWSNFNTNQTLSGLSAGNIAVVISDANNCQTNVSGVIAQPGDLVLNATLTHLNCAGVPDGSIALSVTGGTPPYTYNWAGGQATANLQNLPAGLYEVTVTDNLGCQKTGAYTLTEPAPLFIQLTGTNVLCGGDSNGVAQVFASGGTPPYGYFWSTGQMTAQISQLSGGVYDVTVTDAANCQAYGSITITEPPVLAATISSTPVTCFGATDGTASVSVNGGTPPYSYLWSVFQTGSSVSGLTAGIVSVLVTDANGCTLTLNDTVTGPSQIVITGTTQAITCPGANDGSISTTVVGGVMPYVYDWSNGAATPTISGLAPGVYTLTVTDFTGCLAVESFTVPGPTTLFSIIDKQDLLCADDLSGVAIVTVTGGSPPYSFLWNTNPPQTGFIASGLNAGTYEVTITDATGCTFTDTVQLVAPPALNLVATPVPTSCFGGNNGEVTLSATGGTPPYSYSLNGLTFTGNNEFSNLSAGDYIAVVSDEHGCRETYGFTILQPQGFAVNAGDDIIVGVYGQEQLNAQVIPAGGLYSYFWNPGAGLSCTDCLNPIFTAPEVPGFYDYVFTAINEDDCAFSDTIRIKVSDEYGIFVPNAFTPNNDGVNDFLEVFQIGARKIDFRVFDRWGTELYSNPNITKGQGWDGRFNGKDAPIATYLWMAVVEYYNGETRQETGSFTIIR